MGEWNVVFLEPARAMLYNIGDFLGKFLMVIIILFWKTFFLIYSHYT